MFDIDLLFECIYILQHAIHIQISAETTCNNNLHLICKIKGTCYDEEAKKGYEEFLGTK